jgi:2-dehydropantoate 2-reductase
MRVLIVGAGALGGYFGGRLLEAGRDVRFLVRAGRAGQLARTGLRIVSARGDVTLPAPTVAAGALDGPVDLILMAVKAYQLDAAMDDVAPAVGPGTAIIPVLNGLRHIDILAARFGAGAVLGGVANIPATLGAEGEVIHLAQQHDLTFGEIGGGISDRVRAIAALAEGANFSAHMSEDILQALWEKWSMLATNAGMTCLMRAAIGDIVASPGGEETVLAMLAECCAVAAAEGHAPRASHLEGVRKVLTAPGSTLTASMMRDIDRGAPTEGEHVLGDMVARAERHGIPVPLVRIARCHVAAYAARKAREAASK